PGPRRGDLRPSRFRAAAARKRRPAGSQPKPSAGARTRCSAAPATIARLAPPLRSRCDGHHKNALFCRVLQKMSAGTTALPAKTDVNPDLAISPWCQKPFPCYSSRQPRGAGEVAARMCPRSRETGKMGRRLQGRRNVETIKHDPGTDKPQKTPKELEGMLRAALQEKRGAIVDDFNIRVFRTKAGLPDWDAEILGEKRVVEDDVKAIFASTTLDLQRQFGLAD